MWVYNYLSLNFKRADESDARKLNERLPVKWENHFDSSTSLFIFCVPDYYHMINTIKKKMRGNNRSAFNRVKCN